MVCYWYAGICGIAHPAWDDPHLFSPSSNRPRRWKRTAYESGEIPTSSTHFRFDIQYYMVALLFVVFDIETIFIFPWALIYRDVAAYDLFWALVPMLIFIAVLFVGLIWAWSTGAIQWIVSEAISETEVSP